MIEKLLQFDLQLFSFLNGLGSPYLDSLGIFLSNKFVWIPLYLYLIYRLYQKYGKSFYLYLIVIAVIIIITDQVISSFMKPYFGRLRPCKDPTLDGIVTIIGKCVGKYSFASGHAANTFALATFYNIVDQSTISRFLLIWAGLIAMSRVYLGVHYPSDIIVGSIVGALLSWSITSLLSPVANRLRVY